jgi:UDP-2-acetamido-3-amino-2,3-dideoxy-glucuronate N-acetyltransferase
MIHTTAIVEQGVEIGAGTKVWDNVHIRAPARIGRNCIIGEKSYVAYGVAIDDLVKINAYVYICTGVTIERGVMISAATIFTNDRYPRATSPELDRLLPSEPGAETLSTRVREGTTIGARCVIGPGITIGRFAMIGMGAVVTRDVPDFHLVIGHPARSIAVVCRCGQPLTRLDRSAQAAERRDLTCSPCGRRYRLQGDELEEMATAKALVGAPHGA